ncbi:MAG: GDSL-type esterase/lipase family protein [Clostridiales bacterium]|nr:GDSL-type esterase/lipase family protein [Clostridiales bacterium]
MKKKAISILIILAMIVGCTVACTKAPQTLVVLGDSIAYGRVGTVDRNTESYAAIVANAKGYILYNDAVDGHESRDLRFKLLNHEDIRSHVAESDIVVIYIGGNDFLHKDVEALLAQAANSDFAKINGILSTLEANLQDIFTAISVLNPNATVIVQTLYNPSYGKQRADYQTVCDMVNEVLTDTAGAYGFHILDVGTPFDEQRELIYGDCIHPSVAGHARIAELLLALLNTL